MKKDSTLNTFQDGLIMDLNPLLTPNSALTNCLNGTIVTFNGNENVLQNDMGNGRVETAYLPEGYVPLGSAELGGIIYIVSYNPLIDKCQIGCFPSPERNITSDEVTNRQNTTITDFNFKNSKEEITTTEYKLQLLPDNMQLYSGDQYSIYSTNNGIANNVDNLSFLRSSSKEKSINFFEGPYRNVEIHVICINDDGNILYLDDSVKWYDYKVNNTDIQYYIRDTNKQENIAQDIDDYRTLVSSAYNIFNSKNRGKLALLFKLNIIDTFSVTWDVRNVTKENNKINASLDFGINYTSADPNINPKELITEITLGSNVMFTDDAQHQIEDIKYLPLPKIKTKENIENDSQKSTEDNTETIIQRKNDGTDDAIKIPIGVYEDASQCSVGTFSCDSSSDSAIIQYDVTPAMPFGSMPFLQQSGKLDLTKIGTGIIEFTGWKYYVTNTNVTATFTIEAYPSSKQKINAIYFTLYDPAFLPPSFPIKLLGGDTTLKLNRFETWEKQVVITSKTGYSGTHQVNLNINETIPADCLFIADICIEYQVDQSSYYEHNIRCMYTCKIFNDLYYDNTCNDFNSLSLKEYLTPIITFKKTKDTLDTNAIVYQPDVTNILSATPNDQAYANGTLSAQYTKIDGEINASFEMKDEKYENLFTYELLSCTTTVNKSTINSIYSKAEPKSDTTTDTNADQVKPVSASPDSELQEKSIAPIIASESENNKYCDIFKISSLTQNEDTINISIKGQLYSRIKATLKEKEITSSKRLRPILYNDDDLASLGLVKNSDNSLNFGNVFTMETGDWGNGGDFKLEMSHYGIAPDTSLTGYASETNGYSYLGNSITLKNDFGGDGTFTKDWQEVAAFKNVINQSMLNSGGLFSYWQFAWRTGKGTMRKWKDAKGVENKLLKRRASAHGNDEYYGNLIMMHTDNTCVPIAYFLNKDELSEFTKRMIALYTQLYYVQEDSVQTKMPRVVNITYLTDYNVLLKINIYLRAWQLKIKTKSGSFLTSSFDLSNVRFEDIETYSSIDHTFYITNDDLYNTYASYKNTVASCIATTAYGDFVVDNANKIGLLYIPKNLCDVNNAPTKFIPEFIKCSQVSYQVYLNPEVKYNNLYYMNYESSKPWYYSYNKHFVNFLTINNGQPIAYRAHLLKTPAVLSTTEYSKKSTDFNIKFTGNTKIQILQ